MNVLEELKKIPITQWAAMWCELSKWRIPKELEHLKPEWWDNANYIDKQLFIVPVMDVLTKVIDQRILSWEWNKERMTPEQHWLWWEHHKDEDYFEKWHPLIFPNEIAQNK